MRKPSNYSRGVDKIKSGTIIPQSAQTFQACKLTSAAMVRQDWLKSGLPESPVDANIDAIVEDAKRNLNAWIALFVGSFKAGRLHETLANSYFLREHGELHTVAGLQSGLAVTIRARSISEFKYLISKVKQIRYRLKTRDPVVTFLVLATPNLRFVAVTNIVTGEVVEVTNIAGLGQ